MKRHALTAALLAIALTAPAFAQGFEDLDRLDGRVIALTGAMIGQPGGAVAPIDRRLKLSACPSPVAIEPAGPDTLSIRCAETGWRLRVGLVPAGRTGFGGAAAVKAEPLVRRGDTVEVTVQGDTFDVTSNAVAMDDGAQGQPVRLKLAGNGAQSTGIVTGPGTVSFSR